MCFQQEIQLSYHTILLCNQSVTGFPLCHSAAVCRVMDHVTTAICFLASNLESDFAFAMVSLHPNQTSYLSRKHAIMTTLLYQIWCKPFMRSHDLMASRSPEDVKQVTSHAISLRLSWHWHLRALLLPVHTNSRAS